MPPDQPPDGPGRGPAATGSHPGRPSRSRQAPARSRSRRRRRRVVDADMDPASGHQQGQPQPQLARNPQEHGAPRPELATLLPQKAPIASTLADHGQQVGAVFLGPPSLVPLAHRAPFFALKVSDSSNRTVSSDVGREGPPGRSTRPQRVRPRSGRRSRPVSQRVGRSNRVGSDQVERPRPAPRSIWPPSAASGAAWPSRRRPIRC